MMALRQRHCRALLLFMYLLLPLLLLRSQVKPFAILANQNHG